MTIFNSYVTNYQRVGVNNGYLWLLMASVFSEILMMSSGGCVFLLQDFS